MFWNNGGMNSQGTRAKPGSLVPFTPVTGAIGRTGMARGIGQGRSNSAYGSYLSHGDPPPHTVAGNTAANPGSAAGGGGFFQTPFSTTGYGFQNANGQLAFDVHGPGKGAHTITAPGGYALPKPFGMSEKDAQYFLDHAGARYQLANRMMPFTSSIAKLKAGNYGLYNSQLTPMREQFQSDVNKGYGDLAARGVYSSGARDVGAGRMAHQYANQVDQLSRQFGPAAVRDLQSQMNDARRQYRNDLVTYLISAYNRKHQLDTVNSLGS